MKEVAPKKWYAVAEGVALAVALGLLAWLVWEGSLGAVLARERLSQMFWLEPWAGGGLRPGSSVPGVGVSLLMVALSAYALVRGAGRPKGEFRLPWLLAVVLGALAFVGAGDPVGVWAVGCVVVAFVIRGGARWKLMGMSLLFASGVLVGVNQLWTWTSPSPDMAPGLFWRVAAGVSLAALAGFGMRRAAELSPLKTMGVVALLSCVAYAPMLPDGRRIGLSDLGPRIVEDCASAGMRRNRSALAGYRLSSADASERRHARQEDATDWNRLGGLLSDLSPESQVKQWLLADAALFASGETGPRQDRIVAALAEIPESGPWAQELRGALLLSIGRAGDAALCFQEVVGAAPGNAGGWQALAQAQGRCGDRSGCAKSLAMWLLLEPKAAFSPVLNKPPLLDSCAEAFRHIRGYLSLRPDFDRQGFYLAAEKWVASKEAPLAKASDLGAFKPAPACLELRERLMNLAKAGGVGADALVSSAVTALTDRYVNSGQATQLWAATGAPGAGPEVAGIQPLRTRPAMSGRDFSWLGAGDSVGTRLVALEEDVWARLLVYGGSPLPCLDDVAPALSHVRSSHP